MIIRKQTPQQRHERYIRNRAKERAGQAEYRRKNLYRIRLKDAEWRNKYRKEIRAKQRAKGPVYREHSKVLHAAWRRRNQEDLRAYFKQWYAKHKNGIYAYIAEWKKANPEKAKAYAIRSEHRRRDAKGNTGITQEQWQAIKSAYGNHCAYCGLRLERLTQDHVIALSKGGTNTIENIVPACKSCNSRKYSNAPSRLPAKRLMV